MKSCRLQRWAVSVAAVFAIAVSCEHVPTEPEVVSKDELSQIPFHRLSGKILFRRTLHDWPGEYYLMLLDAEARELRAIAYFGAYVPANFALSHDGTRALFSYFIPASTIWGYNWQLYLMDVATTSWRRVSSSEYDDSFPTWSPDDRQAAFWSNRDMRSSIWLVDLASDSARHVVDVSDSIHTRVAWFSHGRSFIYVSVDTARHAALYRFDFASSSSSLLYALDVAVDQAIIKHPALSPDDEKLAFVRVQVTGVDEIWVLDLTSGVATRLTTGISDWHPAWSRDGAQILFGRGDHLAIMNSDGSQVERVTFGDHTNEYPSWVP
ncbi:MAG: PD40 domain-containing protein [Calditrichaeota bacterium]|nr:PD40 domain-containing protein [Calditrichota bacterium]